MSVPAIYKNGVFQPLGFVDLPESSKVELEIVRVPSADPSAAPESTPWSRFGLGLLGPVPQDFKDLGEEWREYLG